MYLTYDDWRESFNIMDWVISSNSVGSGYRIAWWNEEWQMEQQGRVVDTPDISTIVIEDGNSQRHVLNLYTTVCFIVGQHKETTECSCGAKHTSMPNYHLTYCDVYKRGKSL